MFIHDEESFMSRYSVCFDVDFRFFVVVKWDNPVKKTTGNIVFKSYTESEARDWVLATVEEESREIFNEFG